MKSLDDLKRLIESSGSAIEEPFKRLHHFSKRPPFSTAPSSFSAFVTYCESLTRGVQPGGENERTIQRAYRYVALLGGGSTIQGAFATAWREFPIVRQG